MVSPLVAEPSVISTPSVEGFALDPEPSMKSTSSVDGSALVSEPSAIHAQNVDGSTPGIRTFRDIDPQHGRFRFGPRTFHEIALHRGWFAL